MMEPRIILKNMEHEGTIFEDRMEAGKKLAAQLEKYTQDNPLVLALPRGGVPIGVEVAKKLGVPLDILVARKLGAPFNPELGFGAIAPGDIVILDKETMQVLGLDDEDVNDVIERQLHEMERRILLYRSGEWSKNTTPDTVIVVDDGLATGVTARAALQSARLNFQPKKLVFAAPVCARDSLETIKPYADETICLTQPKNLMAIAGWYKTFDQVSDDEVLDYLNQVNG